MNIVWPLVGCQDGNPLEGGYGWLDWNGDTYHPGIDLNAGASAQADCGSPVVAPSDMTLVQAITGVQNGFGNHVWATDDRTGKWLHFCHLDTIGIPAGSYVSKGSVFATCGRTNGWANGWPYCHVHFEVMNAQPATWEFWPKAYAKDRVNALYTDPIAWLQSEADASQEATTTVDDTERQTLQATIDSLNGVNTELQGQVNDLHTEVSSLRDAVIPALEAQIADPAQLVELKAKLDAITAILARG